jgi:hypothetical protein
MRKIVKAIVRQIDIKYWSGVVLAGFIGSLLTLAITNGQPVAHAQPAPPPPPSSGLSNVEVDWHSFPPGGGATTVNCPTGKIAIGGGAGSVNNNSYLVQSFPIGSTVGNLGMPSRKLCKGGE